MNEKGQRIRLGFFVVAALIALGVLVVMFSKKPTFFARKDHYHVLFENAPNLQPGTPVRRAGIKIGEVESVDLEQTGKVRVVLRVDKKFPPRRNEGIVITQSIISGDATIDLVTDPKVTAATHGSGWSDPVDAKSTQGDAPLTGRGPPDARAAIDRATGIGATAQETLDAIKQSIAEFTKVAPRLDEGVREYTRLAEAIREAVPELRQTNSAVRDFARSANAGMPHLRETKDRADLALKNITELTERLNVLIKTNDQKLSKSIDNLNAVLENAAKVLNEENQKALTELIQNLAKMFGPDNQKQFTTLLTNANKIFTDENVKNINDTLANVRKASANLDSLASDGSKAMKQVADTVSKADKTIENIQKITQPLADKADEITRNVTYTSAQMGLLMKDVRDLMRGYSTSDGTIQKLLTDPSLYNRLNDTVYNMSRLVPKVELILEDMKDFSDQIARHPNRLIFDRGGGLKGSPFAPTGGSAGTSPLQRQSYYPPQR